MTALLMLASIMLGVILGAVLIFWLLGGAVQPPPW